MKHEQRLFGFRTPSPDHLRREHRFLPRAATCGLAAFGIVSGLGSWILGQDAVPATPPVAPTVVSRDDLLEQQADVAFEAKDVERVLTKIRKASDLSKTRIADAANIAESARAALERGNSLDARKDARQAAEMFQEIVKLLEILLEEDPPQRLAAARDMANQLAQAEQEFGALLRAMARQDQQRPGNSGQDAKLGEGQSGQQAKPEPRGGGKEARDPMGLGGSSTKSDKGENGQSGDIKSTGPGAGSAKSTEEKKGGGGGTNPASPESEAGGGGGTSKVQDDRKKPGGGGGDRTDRRDESPSSEGTANQGDPSQKESKGAGPKPGAMTEAEIRQALAARAAQMTRTGQFLEDILKSVSESAEPADQRAAEKAKEILQEANLPETIQAMQDVGEMVQEGKMNEARAASLDVADRMKVAAQRLDAAYQELLAPQVQALRNLEEGISELREQLKDLETQAQIAKWHRKANDLLEQAKELDVATTAIEELLDQVQKNGKGLEGRQPVYDWPIVNDHYTAPESYDSGLFEIQKEAQVRIQALISGDFTANADENVPLKYQDLVERYYQVLSREGVNKKQATRNKGRRTP
jgi:polyhydroxyalkanoate synthesis regulator phasin